MCVIKLIRVSKLVSVLFIYKNHHKSLLVITHQLMSVMAGWRSGLLCYDSNRGYGDKIGQQLLQPVPITYGYSKFM